MNETPILLLSGYLGSGKTTLVNNILTNKKGIKFAVIVNDIGEINIDAALIQKGGVVDQKDDSLVALQNGCICCSLQFDLVEQLSDIVKSGKFDYIVIEASGICEPEPIARTIASIPNMDEKYSIHGLPKLDCIVTVVDALRMKSEFECGNKLDKNVIEEEDIANLVIQQIEFCNTVLLNKASEVSREDLNKIKAIINNLQPGVEIIECDYTNIDLEKIINTHKFEYYKIAAAAGWIRHIEDNGQQSTDNSHHSHEEHEHHHEHEHEHHHHHADEVFTSWGKETAKSVSYDELDNFLKELATNESLGIIIRSKGILKANDNEKWYYYDFVSGDYEIRLGNPDYTGRIVVIGSKMDEHKIEELFFNKG